MKLSPSLSHDLFYVYVCSFTYRSIFFENEYLRLDGSEGSESIFFFFHSPPLFFLQEDIGKGERKYRKRRTRRGWRAVVGDCSTVALLILNLSKAIKQSAGGMSCFNRSAIVREGYGVHSGIYVFSTRIHGCFTLIT